MSNSFYYGLDLGGTTLRGITYDGSQIIKQLEWPHDGKPLDRLFSDMLQSLGQKGPWGLALAGCLDEKGHQRENPNLSFDLSVLKDFLPAIIVNDADAATTAEALHGAGKGFRRVGLIVIGTGLGAALVVDGQPVVAHDGSLHEIGHIPFYSDISCPCGRQGCPEAVLSGRSLEKRFRELGYQGTLEQILKKAGLEQKEMLDQWQKDVGRLIDLFATIQGCQILILHGSVATNPQLTGPLLKTRNLFGQRNCQVTYGKYGPWAGPLGAAILAQKNSPSI